MSTREERRIEACRRFTDLVISLGGQMVGEYVNARTRVEVRCPLGHTSFPLPNTASMTGSICKSCAGQESGQAEAAFRERVASLGGTVLGDYQGKGVPVEVLCRYGHVCSPTPANLRRGQGLCAACVCKVWDVFYVVTGPDGVKFGITSGDPRPRLAFHARNGYPDRQLVLRGLAEGVALDSERQCLRALRAAGLTPVKGREYFEWSALDIVMHVASSIPTV